MTSNHNKLNVLLGRIVSVLIRHKNRNVCQVDGVLRYESGIYYVTSYTQFGRAIVPIYGDYSIIIEQGREAKIDIDLSENEQWSMNFVELVDEPQQPDLWDDF